MTFYSFMCVNHENVVNTCLEIIAFQGIKFVFIKLLKIDLSQW